MNILVLIILSWNSISSNTNPFGRLNVLRERFFVLIFVSVNRGVQLHLLTNDKRFTPEGGNVICMSFHGERTFHASVSASPAISAGPRFVSSSTSEEIRALSSILFL